MYVRTYEQSLLTWLAAPQPPPPRLFVCMILAFQRIFLAAPPFFLPLSRLAKKKCQQFKSYATMQCNVCTRLGGLPKILWTLRERPKKKGNTKKKRATTPQARTHTLARTNFFSFDLYIYIFPIGLRFFLTAYINAHLSSHKLLVVFLQNIFSRFF